jgi:hypothetical protein
MNANVRSVTIVLKGGSARRSVAQLLSEVELVEASVEMVTAQEEEDFLLHVAKQGWSPGEAATISLGVSLSRAEVLHALDKRRGQITAQLNSYGINLADEEPRDEPLRPLCLPEE